MFASAKLHNSRGPDASSCACLQDFSISLGRRRRSALGGWDREEAPGSHSLCHWAAATALLKCTVHLLKIQTSFFSQMVQPCRVALISDQLSNSLEVRML